MKKQFFKPALYVIASTLFLISCKKEHTTDPVTTESSSALMAGRSAAQISNVFKGPNVQLGDGHVRSWIRINHLGMPLEIGVEITASAMSGLPEDDHTNLVLPLHHKAQEVTPFEFIYFNYNAHGHPPVGVFTVPHFDVHFYLTSNEERLAIPQVTPATLPMFTMNPPTGYMAPTYFQAGPEPQMGQHWAPPPPTFLPFSRVMIYGTYAGELTFIEPMVTVAHMLSGGSTQNYLQPMYFAEAGNYPTTYNVYTDAQGNYNITLSNFVARAAN